MSSVLKLPKTERGVVVAVEGAPGDYAPPPGEWETGLCMCFKDSGMCCAVWCCTPITLGQLYERATRRGMLSTFPGVSCLTIAFFLFVCTLYNSSVSNIFQVKLQEATAEGLSIAAFYASFTPYEMAMYQTSSVLGLAFFLCSCCIVMSVRQARRGRTGGRGEGASV